MPSPTRFTTDERRSRRRWAMVGQIALALSLLLVSGCTYTGDRFRDFGHMFRLQGGLGRGLGVTVRAAGLIDIGLNTPGKFPHWGGLGWVYGDPYFLSDDRHETDFMRCLHDETIAVDGATGEYFQSHKCWVLLPAVFSRVDTIAGPDYPESADHEEWIEGHSLWSKEALEENPWAHVHAFDTELGLYALLVNAKAGVSPGEILDFVLGFTTIDIARDDWSSKQ